MYLRPIPLALKKPHHDGILIKKSGKSQTNSHRRIFAAIPAPKFPGDRALPGMGYINAMDIEEIAVYSGKVEQ